MTMKNMKIAYAMFGEGSNIKFKKGPGDYVYRNLINNGAELFPVGGEPENHELYLKGKTAIYRILGKRFIRQRTPLYLKTAVRKIETQLENLEFDCIFSFGALQLAYIKTDKPFFFWTDTPFQGLLEFGHSHYKNIAEQSLRDGHKADKWVLDNCKLAFYTSQWAADLAINTYNIPREKVIVVPFGANLDTYPSQDEIEKFIQYRIQNKPEVRFLLAGNNWEFKGGPIACEVVEELNKRGIKSKLQVIGCMPQISSRFAPYVELFGVVNKNTPEGYAKFCQLFSEAFCYLMPTRAEAYGHVFAEANAFGLPALGTNTGGVTEIIKDGLNGKAFKLTATIYEYCDFIQRLYEDDDLYIQMCLDSYNEFLNRFVWQDNCRKVLEIIQANLS